LSGGEAFLVRASKDTTLLVSGNGWLDSVPELLREGIERRADSSAVLHAPVFAFAASVVEVEPDIDLEVIGKLLFVVRNERTGVESSSSVRSDGWGQVLSIDTGAEGAIQEGDVLWARVEGPDGETLAETGRYSLTRDDIDRGFLYFPNLQVSPVPSITLARPNRPNPFHDQTTIRYQLSSTARVQLNVYGVDGRLVRQLVDRTDVPGYHVAIWDGRDQRGHRLASGVYFYRFQAGDYERTEKMVLLK
jgi:hypothetical protein